MKLKTAPAGPYVGPAAAYRTAEVTTMDANATMKAWTKAQRKQVDKRIEKAYGQSCNGIQIPVLDIQKVFNVGRQAVAEGVDDEKLRQVIRTFVETIRTN